MRLISGTLGGRTLKTANDEGLRPAMAKTREALFSILETRGINWPQITCLDLFAGSGSLGLECVSRGATLCHMVENGQKPFAALADNVARLDVASSCRLWKMDCRIFLRKKPNTCFNLVFLDPPYRRNLATACLMSLSGNGWLAQDAFVVAELEQKASFDLPAAFTPVTERDLGQTRLHIWKNT